jgi:hypothetical protein
MSDFIHREADYTIRIIAYIAGKNVFVNMEAGRYGGCCHNSNTAVYVNRPIFLRSTDGSDRETEIS